MQMLGKYGSSFSEDVGKSPSSLAWFVKSQRKCSLPPKIARLVWKFSSKPAILSLIPDHADCFVPNSLSPELPDVLSNLCDKSFPDADNLTLLKKTKEIVKELHVTKKQHALVVERTRDRANSKL
ncbi:hypothetical protein P5673_031187 [Acropora cervicornis]|uniref:Uncharacterized protein n=1 Tax=Acropora cervicornis TaxID=6130 RepID=A0AAD9PTH1_ACRCE|nr:hypothetical protein P5673_031187 [Acropora cervicornis]